MLFYIAAALGRRLLFFTDALQMRHAAALLVIHGLAGVLGERQASF